MLQNISHDPDEFTMTNTKTGALPTKATLGAVRYASGQIAKNS